VYASDVDRLYRSVEDLLRLQQAARRDRVKVSTTAGALAIGDDGDPSAEAFTVIGSIFGRLELQKAKKRARAGMATRRKRGDVLGDCSRRSDRCVGRAAALSLCGLMLVCAAA